MSIASNMINVEPTAASEKGTPGHGASYSPGLSYLVGPALYELMKIFAEISILYQSLVTTVTDSSISAAKANESFQIQQGEDARSQAFAQGIAQIAGGALILTTEGINSYTSGKDTEMQNLQAEKEGIESYQGMLKDVMDEGPVAGISEADVPQESVQAQIDELLDQTSFAGKTPSDSENMVLDENGVARYSDKSTMELSGPREQERLLESYKQKLKDVETRIEGRIQALQKQENNRMLRTQAIQSASTGTGQAIGGEYQLEQKKDEANSTAAQNAQQITQGIDNHFRGQVEKMMDAAVQIITTLAAISRANKANG